MFGDGIDHVVSSLIALVVFDSHRLADRLNIICTPPSSVLPPHPFTRTHTHTHTRSNSDTSDNKTHLLKEVGDSAGLPPVSPMHCLEMAWGVLIVLCGATGGAIGAYQSLQDIIEKFQRGDVQ